MTRSHLEHFSWYKAFWA